MWKRLQAAWSSVIPHQFRATSTEKTNEKTANNRFQRTSHKVRRPLNRDVGQRNLMRYSTVILVLLLCALGAFAAENATPNGLMSYGAELDDILAVIVSTNSPLGNLAANLSTNLQVSHPWCDSPPPVISGNTILKPFDDSQPGLRLSVRIETQTETQMVVRADINHFDPKRGYANDGAQWKKLEFTKMNDGHWQLSRDLGGAIK